MKYRSYKFLFPPTHSFCFCVQLARQTSIISVICQHFLLYDSNDHLNNEGLFQWVDPGLHPTVGLPICSFVLVFLACAGETRKSDTLCDGYLLGFPDPHWADVVAFLMPLSPVFNYYCHVSTHHWQRWFGDATMQTDLISSAWFKAGINHTCTSERAKTLINVQCHRSRSSISTLLYIWDELAVGTGRGGANPSLRLQGCF